MSGNDLLGAQHDRVQREVAAQLAIVMDGERELPVAKLQSFRKKEEHRLKLWHRAGGGGKEIAARRTELVDILFREIFRHAVRTVTGNTEISGLLAAAFGGYGRRELNPFSDVDVSFLHVGPKPTDQMEKIISACLMACFSIRSIARNRALRARGFWVVSVSPGRSALWVSRRKSGSARAARLLGEWRDGAGVRPVACVMKRLTMRSSSE